MDFAATQNPQAIYDYLASQQPDLHQPDSGYTRMASAYLLGIATYYQQHVIDHPGAESCPRCTLENVLATVLHQDLSQVLWMLAIDPISAALVDSLLDDCKSGFGNEVTGMVAFTQLLLSGLHPGTLAIERVSKYLHQFPSTT